MPTLSEVRQALISETCSVKDSANICFYKQILECFPTQWSDNRTWFKNPPNPPFRFFLCSNWIGNVEQQLPMKPCQLSMPAGVFLSFTHFATSSLSLPKMLSWFACPGEELFHTSLDHLRCSWTFPRAEVFEGSTLHSLLEPSNWGTDIWKPFFPLCCEQPGEDEEL